MTMYRSQVIDSQLLALPTVDTASGSVATFDTDRAERLVNLEVAIVATQSGSGTPSPSNPRPINGFSACDLVACGKNLFTKGTDTTTSYLSWLWNVDGSVTITGTTGGSARFANLGSCLLKAGSYKVNGITGGSYSTYLMRIQKSGGSVIGDFYNGDYDFTLDSDTTVEVLIRVGGGVSTVNKTFYPMIRFASDTVDTFTAYNGTTETIPFGQTVYGGRLNVGSGVLTVTQHGVVINGSTVAATAIGNVGNNKRVLIPYPTGYQASYDGATVDFNCDKMKPSLRDVIQFPTQSTETAISTYTNGIFAVFIPSDNITDLTSANAWFETYQPLFIYTLETPLTIQLDSKQIQSIIGTNNIYADTGDIIDLKFILSVGKAIS